MKILQIYNKIPYPPKDGGSIAVFNLSSGFRRQGHEVEILAFNTKKHFITESGYQKKETNIFIESIIIGTNINFFKLLKNLIFSKLPYNAERFIATKFDNALKNKIKNKVYDVIQIEGLYMMPYIDTIKKYSNALVSYRAHNIEHEIWERTFQNEKNILKKLYLRILYNRMKTYELSFINKYDVLIPITKRDSERLNSFGNLKKTHISPTGVDIQKYYTSIIEEETFKLFFLGSLDWIPNKEGLLWFLEKVWKPLTIKYADIRLSIAGRNASNSLVNTFKKYKNIDYWGEVNDAIEYIHKHTVMIVPLFSGSGMRIKILEGMAASKVIITTLKGAEGIDAANEKEILIANSAEKFLTYIDSLKTKKISAKEISNEAKKFISDKFDNFAISKSLINFYQKEVYNLSS